MSVSAGWQVRSGSGSLSGSSGVVNKRAGPGWYGTIFIINKDDSYNSSRVTGSTRKIRLTYRV